MGSHPCPSQEGDAIFEGFAPAVLTLKLPCEYGGVLDGGSGSNFWEKRWLVPIKQLW